MKQTLTAMIIAFLATTADAETSAPLYLSGGIICDTLDDVIATLESGILAATCGQLVGQHLGTVTPVVEYTVNNAVFNLVRYDFMPHPNLPSIQYGWFGRPTPIPASIGEPA